MDMIEEQIESFFWICLSLNQFSETPWKLMSAEKGLRKGVKIVLVLLHFVKIYFYTDSRLPVWVVYKFLCVPVF